MSRLTDLIAQAKRENPRLGAALEHEVYSRNQRSFGLVFERHLPEKVELPGRPIRRGDVVHILPERGSLERPDNRTWQVIATSKDETLGRVAQLVEEHAESDETPELRDNVLVDDLVVVAQQDDVIYPGLVQTGEVVGTDDPNAPFHSLINAENFHALKMLTYTHYHKVDCIYIDPPYNTGAKDWKYNNDYVDGEDQYRHSKWLSFMERRLEVAKQLLNPEDSVLIVTIDEKEYLRLGLLLEQTFPEARIQMVSSVISQKGVARSSSFYRTDEYIYLVQFGKSRVLPLALGEDWLLGKGKQSQAGKGIVWSQLRRSGTNSLRTERPKLFYPIYIDPTGPRIVGTGEAPDLNEPPAFDVAPEGTVAVWPIRDDGTEANWQQNQSSLMALVTQGFVRIGRRKGDSYPISYLKRGSIEKLTGPDSQITVTGYAESDGHILVESTGYERQFVPGSHWNISSHDATYHGAQLLSIFLPGRKFPFPKSLYAVEDTLRFFVKDKPEATILDFFSGSGTTAHAVMRLNKQDGGRRRSISVTNNEVGVDEQTKLRVQGLRPGDPEWEQWGICDYVTKPRIQAAITGQTPDDTPIKGDYKFTDEFPMSDGFEANARFFTLTYEPPTRVRHSLAFKQIAPMLWLRAGQTGRIIDHIPDCGWDVTEAYGIIENVAASQDFLDAIKTCDGLKVIYIATNDDLVFESMARELADANAELVRLYSTYLNNFAFQQARENS